MKQYFILLVSLPQLLFAQQNITGKVLDSENTAIAFATVALFNTQNDLIKATTTTIEGTYEFESIKNGKYMLEISYVGYTSWKDTIDVNIDVSSIPTITLQKSVSNLKEVTVEAIRPMIDIKPDKLVFNVEGTINASGSDGMELLRKAPGVNVDNNNNISLKGKQGVQVYIDNRPSQMDRDDLVAYLESVNASQIDNIEIISNPSARYDAAGGAGIINVILKKQKEKNANAILNLGFQQGFYAKQNGSISSNYKKNKLNLFVNTGIRSGKRRNFHDFYREQNGSKIENHSVQNREATSFNYKLGADYSLSKNSTVGIFINGGSTPNWNATRENTALIGLVAQDDYQTQLSTYTDDPKQRSRIGYNANYLYKDTSSRTFSINIDYAQRDRNTYLYQENIYSDIDLGASFNEENMQNNTITKIVLKSVKADYETPLLKGMIGTGVKVSNATTNNDFEFFDVIANIQTLNQDHTNYFDYTESIYAAYVEYKRDFNKLKGTAGLRTEQTETTGTLTTPITSKNQSITRSYLNLFPSVGLSYQASKKSSIGINYSRRINRPSYRNLNPFQYRLSSISYASGNPLLLPEYTDRIEFTHSYNRFLNSSIGYSYTDDFFSDVLIAIDSNIVDQTPVNLAYQKMINLNTSAYLPIGKKVSSFISFDVVHMQNKSELDSLNSIDIQATWWNVYAQNTFTVNKKTKLEISGWVSSPGIWQGNMKYKWQGTLDIGMQKKILSDKGSLKLSLTDILGTNGWGVEANTGGLYMKGGGNHESQQIRVNFSYTFGNKKLKTKSAKTGIEDENKRSGEGSSR